MGFPNPVNRGCALSFAALRIFDRSPRFRRGESGGVAMRHPLFCLSPVVALLGALCGLLAWGGGPPAPEAGPRFRVPPGFVVEKVAGPPLVRYPLFAALDDRGRLFVAEGTGTNLPGTELLKQKKQLGRILLLEDTDGDGRFDKSTVFADDLTFPTGILWHDGVVYATSHPCLWRFEDTDR